MKCGEERPNCVRCTRAKRECVYTLQIASTPCPPESTAAEPEVTSSSNGRPSSAFPCQDRPVSSNLFATEISPLNGHEERGLVISSPRLSSGFDAQSNAAPATGPPIFDDTGIASGSPFASFHADSSSQALTWAASPGSAPFRWYDLVAQDALTYFEKNSLLNRDVNWDFDPRSLSRRPSASHNLPGDTFGRTLASHSANAPQHPLFLSHIESDLESRGGHVTEPWNLPEPVVLQTEELRYLEHYVQKVAPILDLFDPAKHFGNIVPHMALRNVGLLKALLAVAARHMSLELLNNNDEEQSESVAAPQTSREHKDRGYVAIQYFYETLKSLAAAMQIPSYTRSSEILATAILISTYEMFDGSSQEWERHLKGSFWIQRTQDNDGESRGLREAVWWAWVRQDIWAAFREARRTLTIWRPKKPLSQLTPDELATRVVYLLAKAVSYASKEAMKSQGLAKRLEDSDALLQALDDWFQALPHAYKPIPFAFEEDAVFRPIWIHPPAYAAAVQSYYFAKTIILLNKPSTGGVASYHKQQKVLRDASKTICGLGMASTCADPASAFVNLQCLYAGKSEGYLRCGG